VLKPSTLFARCFYFINNYYRETEVDKYQADGTDMHCKETT
jgi:hypothetical protein